MLAEQIQTTARPLTSCKGKLTSIFYPVLLLRGATSEEWAVALPRAARGGNKAVPPVLVGLDRQAQQFRNDHD